MRQLNHPNRLTATAAVLMLMACALAALTTGCAANGNGDSAQITDRWQQKPESGAPSQPYRTVFVVGVAHSEDVRRLFEDEFVRQLQGQGVRGIASHSVMPRLAEGRAATRDEVVQAVRASAADGVVVTRLLKREERQKASFSPEGYYTHYSAASRSRYGPPVIYRTEVVTLETRLFDTASEQQVWAATTEAFDPRTTQTEITRLVRAIVKDLKKGDLI